VLSHALFGNVPTIGATLLALPRLLWRQWLPVLTWLRFDPARSFHLPVLQLENLRGRERRARQRVLDQDRRGSSWLTIICLNIDFALQLALLALLGMLLPELINMDFLLWLEHFSRLEQIGLNLLALLALSIIEPFYVAAGFALYLNRRTILEAWDIEIGFRRLAERLGRKISTPLSAVCAGLLLTGAVLAPLPLPAQQNAQPETSISDACETLFARQEKLHRSASEIQQTLGDVFDEAQFAQCRKETTWRLGDSDWKLDTDPVRAATDPWLPGLGNAIELLLWIVVILFAGLLAVWLIRQRRERRPPVKPDLPVPVSAPLVYGPSPDVEIFTDSCAQEAWQLWQSGRWCRGRGPR
jgi:hypothetical protein